MELALSLGDAPNSNNKPFGFLSKPSNNLYSNSSSSSLMALGYCVALGHHSRSGSVSGSVHYDQDRRDVLQHDDDDDDDDGDDKNPILSGLGSGFDPPVQLDLLPLVPVPRSSHLQFSWISHRLMPEVGYSETEEKAAAGAVAAVAALSSPKSTMSCLEMELGFRKRSSLSDMENERGGGGGGGGSSRIMSDDEETNNIIIGCAPKKLRLSKHQSAFLEESFKEHTTLNPKQKLALAKQLNLRPRQVEVWFQNRRARTKLKQTEVDCEYLRRCCETLTEENRRLQKELQELRALKTTPSHPFYNMHLPPTTLTMCPSCERVVVTTSPPAASVTVPVPNPPPSLCLANNPRISPFPHTLHQQAAS